MTNPNHRSQTRVIFERGIKAHIMGIDGTWRRGCTMVDISETSVRLTVDGSLTDLNGIFPDALVQRRSSPALRAPLDQRQRYRRQIHNPRAS